MNFLAILWNLKSYLMSKQVIAFNKSKYCNSDTTIAFFGRYNVSIRIFSSISIIWWHSNIIWMTINLENKVKSIFPYYLYYILDYLWYQTSYLTSKCYLTPSKSKNVKHSDTKIGCPSKKITYTHSETNTVIWLRYLAFWMIFGPFWVILGVHDVTKGVKILQS